MKTPLLFGVLFFVASGWSVWQSPFQYRTATDEYTLETTVLVNCNAAAAFAYLGNSAHAQDWSVFVHHITPLNASQHPDGALRSTRRCFRNANEAGSRWDEEVVQHIPNRLREITIYNLIDFPIVVDDMVTRQHYAPIDSQTVRLTFGLYKKASAASWIDRIKLNLGGYRVAAIFNANLANIKKNIEAQCK